jgi:hypothetical protein
MADAAHSVLKRALLNRVYGAITGQKFLCSLSTTDSIAFM